MTPTHKDVTWKNSLKLDIFLPDGDQPTGGVQAIIYVHGGQWKSGGKSPIRAWSRKVRDDLRFAVVSIEYRLTGSATWGAQGDDVLDAVKWVKTKGSSYGIDTNRVGCLGESAGAHLCYYMATAGAANSATRLTMAVGMFGETCFLCQGYTDQFLAPLKNVYGAVMSQDYLFGFKEGTLQSLKEAESNPTSSQATQIKKVQTAEPLYQLVHVGKGKTPPIFID